MQAHLEEISKYLSYILRHAPESISLSLDVDGWADISTLIACSSNHGRTLNRTLIETLVSTNDKRRFSISEDGQRIRAAQGHSSSSVRREYPEKTPPTVLYHGTATRFLASIRQDGLKAGARHHVHLSEDISIALSVGMRHGRPVVLEIQSFQMSQKGFKFYVSENRIWLTDFVPMEFIRTVDKLK